MKGLITTCCLVFMTLIGSGEAFITCPEGATKDGNFCFIASKTPQKMQYAQMFCLNYGCVVSEPWNYLKNNLKSFALNNQINRLSFLVTDIMNEGTWIAGSTGEEFTDTDWEDSKPTQSRNNNCIRINSVITWKMVDASCNGKEHFICMCNPISVN